MTTLTDFLLARIAEDEVAARAALGEGAYPHFGDTAAEETLEIALSEGASRLGPGHFERHHPARVLRECEAKRQVIAFHRSWPVFTETRPELLVEEDDLGKTMARMRQQMEWHTQDEYRAKFGDEPPTTPMLAALAAVYSDHPDFDPTWA